MKNKTFKRLQGFIENDIGVTKSAIGLLMTILMVGTWMVFALSNYGGEIGLITKEEPRLAYLYCREALKSRLNLSDNSQFDNYLEASIYPIQAHQYLVRLRLDIELSPTAQVDAYLPCTISIHPNGTWTITQLNYRP